MLGGLRVNNSVNIETIFHILLVVICITLNVKPLKKCMYLWVPSIVCPKLTSLYINYMTNGFVPVVQKRILDIFSWVSCLFFKHTSSIFEYILVESLIYFLSVHPRFASLFKSSFLSIFWSYILDLRVYFSRVSCLFFSLHPRLANPF